MTLKAVAMVWRTGARALAGARVGEAPSCAVVLGQESAGTSFVNAGPALTHRSITR